MQYIVKHKNPIQVYSKVNLRMMKIYIMVMILLLISN